MTTPTAPDAPAPSTAVAKRDFAGTLPPAYQAALAIRKQQAMMFAEVSKQSWGTSLDATQRRAIAAYCERHTLDPSMIDFLGGRLYRNANFWLDRGAKLVAAGLVEYVYPDYITADPRLKTIAEDASDPERADRARQEWNRRQDERIRWQVPEEALSACVFRIKVKGMEREVCGCKPVIKSDKDPVGNANPVMTAETRSARRAYRKVIELSPEVKQLYETVEVDWRDLSGAVQIPAGDLEEDDRPTALALPGGAMIRAAGVKVKPLADGEYATPEAEPTRMREPGEEDDQADLLEDQRLAKEEEAKAGKKRR